MKNVVRVDLCDEFKCPFFHAGIMGHLECTATKPRSRDVSRSEQGQAPPSWCPLRISPIKVSL